MSTDKIMMNKSAELHAEKCFNDKWNLCFKTFLWTFALPGK